MWVILSAILCNLAFFFPSTCGFLITVCPLPLYKAVHAVDGRSSLSFSFVKGLLWGILFFSIHFVWLAHLLVKTTHLSLAACFLCYSGVVVYYAVAAGIWLAVSMLLKRSLLIFLGTFILYFHWITSYSLWFFTHVRGYPFLSLLIPLTGHRWFLSALVAFNTYITPPRAELTTQENLPIHLVKQHEQGLTTHYHLTAGGKRYKIIGMRLPEDLCGPSIRACEKRTPLMLGQFLYHTLTSIDFHITAHTYEKIYIMAPESTFPYALERFPEVVSLVQGCLPPQAVFIFGSIHKRGEKSFQSLFTLTSSALTCWYDKKVLINGTEIALPWPLPSFFPEPPSLVSGSGIPHFTLESPAFTFVPFVCAEAFIKRQLAPHDKPYITCAYVNDAWFLPYMQELLFLLFRLQSACEPHVLHLYLAHSRTCALLLTREMKQKEAHC